MAYIETYRRINNRYRKRLIYRFGDEAGFFSELNNMILAMLFCLEKRIQFVLFTPPDGKLSIYSGWNDYFLPFCEQNVDPFHKENNERFLLEKLAFRTWVKRYVFKRMNGFDYYTYELWNEFRSDAFIRKPFNFPDLGINGNVLDATKAIIDMLWRFSPGITDRINIRISELGLPTKYAGLHIRSGDKVIEAKVFSPDEYMDLLMRNTELKDVFVLSDDYRCVEYLREHYKDYRFYSTCGTHERGYDFSEFLKLDKEIQYSEYAKLLASMDVLMKSDICFGSYKTNPGMFLGMSIGKKFIGIDSDKWLYIW